MHPARHIEASNAEAGRILGEILETVLAGGAEIHSDARLREVDGAMSLHCVSEDTSGPLVRMPRELLVPIDGAVWADSAEELRLESEPPGLTQVQRGLLDLHIALYNATGKLAHLTSTHPRVALRHEPDLVRAIQTVRPGFGQDWPAPAEVFLSTRTFVLEPVQSGARDRESRVILPVIDLLNHHPDGARLAVDTAAMAVEIARPIPGDEVFGYYGGRRDVLDHALQYGYVDDSPRIARSAPVEVQVDGVGTLVVGAASPRRVHPMDPPLVRMVDDRLILSHLTYQAGHPEWARAALVMPLTAAGLRNGLSRGKAEDRAEEAVRRIVEANRQRLQGIVRAAAEAPEIRAAAMTGDAADTQARLIADSLR